MIRAAVNSVLLASLLLWMQGSVFGDVAKEPADSSGVTSAEVGKYGLVAKFRPLLSKISTADPIRVALHFETADGPIEHHTPELGQQLLDRSGTIESLTVAVKSTGREWQTFKAGKASKPTRPTGLSYNPTFFLELRDEKLVSLNLQGQEEFSAEWAAEVDKAVGEMEVTVKGTLKLTTAKRKVLEKGKPARELPATKTEIEFRTKPIKLTVARADMTFQSLDMLAKEAVKSVKLHRDIERENLTVVGAESIPIGEGADNRVIRVRADLPPLPPGAPRIGGGRGYWQYEVVMNPLGMAISTNRWRKGFCLAEGTMVALAEGEVAVEDLRTGDRVLAYDCQRQVTTEASVIAISSSTASRIVSINDSLELTPEHPVYVRRGDRDFDWHEAAALRVGDLLLSRSGDMVEIKRVAREPRLARVYDVAVDGPHNFFADEVLVHNKSIAWTPRMFVPWYALWNRAPRKE